MGAPQIQYAIPAGGGVPVGVSGTGTVSRLAKFTAATTIADSGISDDGTTVSFISRNLASTAAQTWTLNGSLSLLSGITGFYNAGTDGTYGDVIYIGAASYPTTYRHRIKASVSATATNALMTFSLNSGASSFTDVMTLRGDGNVGIGTTSPGAQLHVARAGGLSAGAEYLRLQNSSAGSGSNVTQTFFVHGNTVATGSVSHTWSGTTYDMLFSVWNNSLSSMQEAMRIQGGGNVGIGTASPQEKTQVYGDLKIGVTASNSFLTFGDEGTTSKFNGIYRPASSNTLALGSYNLITFNVSAAALGSQTERMRIDSSGTLCVGTNVSATSLNKLIVADGNNGKGYEVRPGATCQILAYDRTAGAYLPNSLSALSHTFSVSGNNAVVVGASSMDASALAGYGLKLPATPGNADTQTLDCYQDGGATAGGIAYTPVLTNFGGTVSSVTGRYIRVGGAIYVTVNITGTSLTTTAFTATVTSPPFNAAGTDYAATVRASSGTATNAIHFSGSQTVYIGPAIAASSQITMSWFYFV